MSNLNIPAQQWLKEQFTHHNCEECHRGARSHDAIPFMGNWFARCKPRHCNQVLYGNGTFRARCIQTWGTEHSHHDYTAEQAVKKGLAVKIKSRT